MENNDLKKEDNVLFMAIGLYYLPTIFLFKGYWYLFIIMAFISLVLFHKQEKLVSIRNEIHFFEVTFAVFQILGLVLIFLPSFYGINRNILLGLAWLLPSFVLTYFVFKEVPKKLKETES